MFKWTEERLSVLSLPRAKVRIGLIMTCQKQTKTLSNETRSNDVYFWEAEFSLFHFFFFFILSLFLDHISKSKQKNIYYRVFCAGPVIQTRSNEDQNSYVIAMTRSRQVLSTEAVHLQLYNQQKATTVFVCLIVCFLNSVNCEQTKINNKHKRCRRFHSASDCCYVCHGGLLCMSWRNAQLILA